MGNTGLGTDKADQGSGADVGEFLVPHGKASHRKMVM